MTLALHAWSLLRKLVSLPVIQWYKIQNECQFKSYKIVFTSLGFCLSCFKSNPQFLKWAKEDTDSTLPPFYLTVSISFAFSPSVLSSTSVGMAVIEYTTVAPSPTLAESEPSIQKVLSLCLPAAWLFFFFFKKEPTLWIPIWTAATNLQMKFCSCLISRCLDQYLHIILLAFVKKNTSPCYFMMSNCTSLQAYYEIN